MINFPLLSLITFLPIMGAGVILIAINGDDERQQRFAKYIALFISLATFLISVLLWFKFDKNEPNFQFTEKQVWFENYNIAYYLGIDGISLFFILLTTLLTPICIASCFMSVHVRVKEYVICFLVLESLVIGVFAALDLLLFYVFFEAMLIPMFLIIGVWGGQNRVYAAIKFFLYTLAGSVFLLLGIIFIFTKTSTMAIPELFDLVPKFDGVIQNYLWLAFFISFAVKVPMWPVHTWLHDAHVEAPTSGSVILAGILLKMGGYGFLRFSLPMLPEASIYFAPFIFVLSVIAVIYASLVAFVQEDMKKLIAYSSIAHMGFVTIGIFTFNVQGMEGAIVQMLSHGLVSAALFLCVGVLYERMHTKEIKKFGGVVERMPKFALIFMFFTMASVGLPGTSGFVGEFLVLLGTFSVSKIFALLTASGVVLGATYMLYLYKEVMFGQVTNKEVENLQDLSLREIIIFVPLIILTLVIGIYPSFITDILGLPVGNIITHKFVK